MSVRESRNLRASGRGVLIYWHVERKSMAIHSQLIGCPASEVAAMIEGVMRHGAVMEVEASSIGFTGVTANGKSMDTLNPVQITMPDTSVADMASDGSFSVNYTGTGFAQWFGL